MKTIDAITAHQTIARIRASGEKFPQKFSYALALNAARLEPIVKGYNEVRMQLLDEHGEKDEAGKLVTVNDNVKLAEDKREAFVAAHNQLAAEEVEVSLHKVLIADFPAEIDLDAMMGLMPMVLEPAKAE